jgi:hypothetical protein
MKIKTVIIITALVAALGAAISLAFLRQAPISEEGAIAKIRTYIAGVEKIPEENIRIDRIESRPPTESESDFLLEWGEEPPELMWFADVTRLFGDVGPRAGIIWLDAHTGEIIYGSFLD